MFKTDLITKRDMSKDFCWILTEDLVYENDKYTITAGTALDLTELQLDEIFIAASKL